MKTKQERTRRPVAVFPVSFALLAAVLTLGAASGARAAERPLLPGVGSDDRRVPVPVEEAPWRSLVRVQTNLGGRCTGALVAPRRVLTAAHCLFNARTRRFFPDSSLHVLFGYARGDYSRHVTVTAVATDPAYDPAAARPDTAADWAVLTLAEPAPEATPPLPLAAGPSATGMPVMLGGYSQDRAQILMADRDCRVLGAGSGLIAHDCDATRGTSGGPLLVREAAGWAVAGVGVAAGRGPERRNFAVPTARFLTVLRGQAAAGQP
ncbi:trypsin-like serine peptidase [Azospirillum doebereinerae]